MRIFIEKYFDEFFIPSGIISKSLTENQNLNPFCLCFVCVCNTQDISYLFLLDYYLNRNVSITLILHDLYLLSLLKYGNVK